MPLSAFNLALTPTRSPARSCGKRGAESKAGSGANGSWMGKGGGGTGHEGHQRRAVVKVWKGEKKGGGSEKGKVDVKKIGV